MQFDDTLDSVVIDAGVELAVLDGSWISAGFAELLDGTLAVDEDSSFDGTVAVVASAVELVADDVTAGDDVVPGGP